MENCVCGSGKLVNECCKKFLSGEKVPVTAEELMRSRYYAFTVQDVDYLMNTHDPKTIDTVSRDSLEEWSKNSVWISLDIIATEKGGANDERGTVEFLAIYKVKGETYRHHEKSLFIKKDGKWYFSDTLPFVQTIVNENKVGRNDPCSCGSGKKYKKCCGK